MLQPNKFVIARLAFVILCLGSATAARADTITFTGNRTAANVPPAVPNVERCGAPPNLLIGGIVGTGTSNLGAFTAEESNCINPAAGTLFNGLFTYTFANGSTLFGTATGTVTLPPINGVAPVSLTYNITGGTGMFAGATGTLLASGPLTFNPDGTTSTTFDITGTVTTVPEPATLLLLGGGLAGLGASIRRKQKRRE
jgi:hypothetical protein